MKTAGAAKQSLRKVLVNPAALIILVPRLYKKHCERGLMSLRVSLAPLRPVCVFITVKTFHNIKCETKACVNCLMNARLNHFVDKYLHHFQR